MAVAPLISKSSFGIRSLKLSGFHDSFHAVVWRSKAALLIWKLLKYWLFRSISSKF